MSLTRSITRALTQPLTRPLTAPGVGGGAFDPVSLFAGGRKGAYYNHTNKANLYTDAARTTPVSVATDLIGSSTDLSGNGYHASQAGVIRPAWNNGRAEFASADFLKAANVDFSGTDVVTVVMAVYKANDTSGTAMLEHGLGNSLANRGFRVSGPPYSGGGGFGVAIRGTAVASAQNAPNTPAPVYAVVTIICRISTDTCLVRVNGVVSEAALTDQGTGNFTLDDLYLNASAGTNLYFGGNHYASLVIDKELTEASLNNLEAYFASLLPGVTIGAPKFTLAAIGDSYTYAVNGGVTANQAYMKQLDTRIPRVVWSANLGASGNSTSDMMARRRELLRIATPNIATIYGGRNDAAATTTVAASPTPTSTVFTLTSAAGHAVDGWITVGGEQAQILSLAGAVVTLTAPLAGGAPAALAAVTIDTQKNLTELGMYVKNAGCTRILMIGQHYANLASGADTVTVQQPVNAALRVKQQAAAATIGAVYVDIYAWGCARINGGFNAQGDALWHVSSSDDHLSLAGQTNLMTDAIEAALIAQGWT